MKNLKRLLILPLACLMPFSAVTACGNHLKDSPATDSQETSSEAPRFQTSELSLPAKEDLFPDFLEQETWTQQPRYESVDVRVEAEDYTETTLPVSFIEGTEFSGGVMLRSLQENPPQGWDHTYAVSYRVQVSKPGTYRLTALSGDLDKDYTSDYFVDVNGKRAVDAAKVYTVLEDFPCSFDSGLFKIVDLGSLTLAEGENVITFTVDNADSQSSSWNRISFFMDYFELTYEGDDLPQAGCSASYAVTPAGDHEEALLAAETVNVFDSRYPLRLKASAMVLPGQTVDYTLTDFYGNVLYSGATQASEEGWITLERTVKNHPTGYFLFTVGDLTCQYVVLDAFGEGMPSDSPFAMDFAAYYLVRDPQKTFALASAARMAGVTWVRERADWRTYEAVKGQYDFTSTEEVYRAIDRAGMNLLVMLCAAPSWATDPLSSTTTAGGFLTAQKDIYNTTRAMAAYYGDTVDAWELWNEPDASSTAETAELFAAWYKSAALGVYDANPNAVISFGGLCHPGSVNDYMQLSLLNDLLDYSSIFNYHAHVWQEKKLPDFSRNLMVSYTGGMLAHYNTENKPVWVTEAGMWIGTPTPSQENLAAQAPYVVTSAVQSLSTGSDKHFWFVLSPYLENGGDFGTFSKDLQPYPSLAAEATMTRVLGKAQYLGELYDIPAGAFGYVFDTGSRAAAVLWAEKAATYTFDAEKAVIVTDLMGAQTLVKPRDGRITLEIGASPLFVTYSDPPRYQDKETAAAAAQPLQLDAGQRVIIYPEFVDYDINDSATKQHGHKIADGTRIRLHIVNLNGGADVTGRIEALLRGFTVSGCDGEISVPAMGEVILDLTLRKTTEERVDGLLTFSGEFNGCPTSRSTARVYTDEPAGTQPARLYGIRDGKVYGPEALAAVQVRFDKRQGTGVAYVNGREITSVTSKDNLLILDLSSIGEGRHTVVAGRVTPDGELIHTVFYVNCCNGTVTFELA